MSSCECLMAGSGVMVPPCSFGIRKSKVPPNEARALPFSSGMIGLWDDRTLGACHKRAQVLLKTTTTKDCVLLWLWQHILEHVFCSACSQTPASWHWWSKSTSRRSPSSQFLSAKVCYTLDTLFVTQTDTEKKMIQRFWCDLLKRGVFSLDLCPMRRCEGGQEDHHLK